MEFKIDIPDKKIEQEIKANWDRVAKPLDGLGEFEGLLARIGAILGSPEIDIAKKAVIVMCADNGVVAEGISQSGQEITAAVTENLGKRNTSVCKMAKAVGAEIFPVDIGVNTDRIFPGVISRKVKKGTNDFLLKPAMSEREAMQAVRVGMELVKECKEAGYTLLGTGEMGIGNTTTSAAMAAALLECMSNLTANEMFTKDGMKSEEEVVEKIVSEIQTLSQKLDNLVIVTNNVFEDGVIYDAGTMEYLKALGRINAALARLADRVAEVVVGIPVELKG